MVNWVHVRVSSPPRWSEPVFGCPQITVSRLPDAGPVLLSVAGVVLRPVASGIAVTLRFVSAGELLLARRARLGRPAWRPRVRVPVGSVGPGSSGLHDSWGQAGPSASQVRVAVGPPCGAGVEEMT